MNTRSWNAISAKVIKVLWALLFLTLPVTSFPFFPSGLGGKTLVRPLAIYPLVLIILLATIPRFLKRPLPRTFLPLFAFMVIALISSVAAFSLEFDVLRGVTVAERFVRNTVTLGIGIAFYIAISLLHDNWDDLRFSLRWLYTGFGIALLWGTLQIPYVVHYSPLYFNLLNRAQSFISTRKLFTTRISGPAYEPKWFAEQICFLLLPWLLGSVLSGRSLFRWRYKWITVEVILIVWASIILIFTFSRTGLLILLLLALMCFLMVRSSRFRPHAIHPSANLKRPVRRRGRTILEAMLLVLGLLAVFVALGSQNPYFSRLWRYWTEAKTRNRTYLEFIAFQQRFVYWETALRMFEEHPLLGVGLGNYAFFFDEMLPDRQWDRQKEIVRQITPAEGRDRLITPKNLYARLLAETGLFGSAAFTTFLLAMGSCALFLWFSHTDEQKYYGLCGLLSLVVFLIIVSSFDSFALPNMWIIFGLITASAHLLDPVSIPGETVQAQD